MRNVNSAQYRLFLRRLVAARKESGLTQQQVSSTLGMPQSRVSDIETGQTRVDVVEINDFMWLYNKPFDYFMKPRK